MPRSFSSSEDQFHVHRLRNDICRLGTTLQLAEVKSHLRDFAVAEIIGFIAVLDGHAKITSPPTVETSGAVFQQIGGTHPNPFAHASPANILLNGARLDSFYRSEESQDQIRRALGMGLMAPDDWNEQSMSGYEPRQHNYVDWATERYRSGGGLVDAFKACGEAAVQNSLWKGSGKRRHDLTSLTKFISDVYAGTWVPLARAAYSATRSHFVLQMSLARTSNPQRLALFEHRLAILDVYVRVFERESSASPEAAKNVWKFTSAEKWT